MKHACLFKTLGRRLAAAVLGAALPLTSLSQENPAGSLEEQVQALRQQVEELSNLAVRTQSHVMMDVEYHFTNLWFAGRNEQWDLAAFYLRETRSHVGWAVRVRPVRSVSGGGSVDLRPFQQSIGQAGFAQIQNTIDEKDIDAFTSAYRQTMSQCQACHQASGLGYLEPHIPEDPVSMMMLREQ